MKGDGCMGERILHNISVFVYPQQHEDQVPKLGMAEEIDQESFLHLRPRPWEKKSLGSCEPPK